MSWSKPNLCLGCNPIIFKIWALLPMILWTSIGACDAYKEILLSFESNLLNVFSIPAYFNEGSRYYILLKYEYKKNVELWLRYAAFVYANQTALGTGPERIDGSTRSEVGVQLRVRF